MRICSILDLTRMLTLVYRNSGLLSKAKFYRVIADEAQFIRNRYAPGFFSADVLFSCIYLSSSTRASISLATIKSKLRWMLTGTPVTNTL